MSTLLEDQPTSAATDGATLCDIFPSAETDASLGDGAELPLASLLEGTGSSSWEESSCSALSTPASTSTEPASTSSTQAPHKPHTPDARAVATALVGLLRRKFPFPTTSSKPATFDNFPETPKLKPLLSAN